MQLVECPYCGELFRSDSIPPRVPPHSINDFADEFGDWACFGGNTVIVSEHKEQQQCPTE